VSSPIANVRGGPGTSYSIVGRVNQGQQFEITGRNPTGDWWQFNYNGRPAWIFGQMVSANVTASDVQVASNIPAPPTPRPTARPAPTKPAPTAAPAYKYRVLGLTRRVNTNNWITIYCQLSPDKARGIASTLRIIRGGGTIREQPFGTVLLWANTGMSAENQFLYNENCKVELQLEAGGYTAYLIEGGQQVSEPINFDVSGDIREFVLAWKPK
jgi:uncharacterized protein YgiM (DUF1202 family)